MTKRKSELQIEVLPPEVEEEPDFAQSLQKAVKHLLDRVLNAKASDEMTVGEETAAIKACTAYYLDVVKADPAKTNEGSFNGFRAAVADIPTNRRARNGSRDGGTDDADAF